MAEQPITKLIPIIPARWVDEALDNAMREAQRSNSPDMLGGVNSVKWHLQKRIERGQAAATD
jgi:hypothetical protein